MTGYDFDDYFLVGLLAAPFVEGAHQIAAPRVQSAIRWIGLVLAVVMAVLAASGCTFIGQFADAILLVCSTAFVGAFLWHCIRIRSNVLRRITMACLLMVVVPAALLIYVTARIEGVVWEFIRRTSLSPQVAYYVTFHGDLPTRAGHYFVEFVRTPPWFPFLEKDCGRAVVDGTGAPPESLVVRLVTENGHDSAEVTLGQAATKVVRID